MLNINQRKINTMKKTQDVTSKQFIFTKEEFDELVQAHYNALKTIFNELEPLIPDHKFESFTNSIPYHSKDCLRCKFNELKKKYPINPTKDKEAVNDIKN